MNDSLSQWPVYLATMSVAVMAESEEEVAELFRDLKNRSYSGEDPGLAELSCQCTMYQIPINGISRRHPEIERL